MKTRLLATCGLIAALGTSGAVGTLAQNGLPGGNVVVGRRHMNRERHPELQRALRNLRQAKANLQNAARDFGGHRAKAADLIDQAIDQVQQASQADRR